MLETYSAIELLRFVWFVLLCLLVNFDVHDNIIFAERLAFAGAKKQMSGIRFSFWAGHPF